jgi:hypothetical protein
MKMNNKSGILRIDKVVAEFEVWLDADLFPFPKMKVKVLQRSEDFAAFSNVSRRDRFTGFADGIAGLGGTADEALRDLLTRFDLDVREFLPQSGYVEADFAWSSPEDF